MKIKRSEILSQMLEESKMDRLGFEYLLWQIGESVETLKVLTEREADIFFLIYDGATLSEIGEKYNVTRERVRQILVRILRKIRYRLMEFTKEYEDLNTLNEEVKRLRLENNYLRKHSCLKEQYQHPILSPIEGMNLSIRAMNCLKSAEIETVEELKNMTTSDLLKFRNFGKKSIKEIREVFKSQYNIDWN